MRKELIASLKNELFDIVIIGGGATGAGAALDAASRGLKTALIEAYDFSFGTSSRSTKLIHGGVRYLENAFKHLDLHEYALVKEALKERKLFLENAPHLTRTLPIITPVYSAFEAFYYWIGLKCYDVLAGKASLGRSQFLSREKTLARFPMLKKNRLKGAVLYYDGQFDDARMNVTLILSAINEGACAINYVKAQRFIKERGQIIGILAQDMMSGETMTIRGKIVINATGPYADQIRKMDQANVEEIIKVSQGSHVLLPHSFSPSDIGLVIPKTSDGRVIFLLPWQGKTLAGTTDHKHALTKYPKATETEVDYILKHMRNYFDLPLGRDDVMATWSGLRPLADPKHSSEKTAEISRDHFILVSKDQLITIVGGKWTTYRKMAEDVIDRAVEVGALKSKCESKTKTLKLKGSLKYKASLYQELMSEKHIAKDIALHIAHAYGDQAWSVLDVDPSLNKRLVIGFPYLEAEVIYGVRYELALHVCDILARRLRLAFLSYEASKKALERVAALMAKELSWDQSRTRNEFKEAHEFLETMRTTF